MRAPRLVLQHRDKRWKDKMFQRAHFHLAEIFAIFRDSQWEMEMFILPPNTMLGTHPEQVWGLRTGSQCHQT